MNKPRTCTAKIYGSPEEFQTVLLEYEFIVHSKMFEPKASTVEVNFVKLLQRLRLTPSDLYTDIQHAIATDLSCPEWIVKIDCEITEAFSNVRV